MMWHSLRFTAVLLLLVSMSACSSQDGKDSDLDENAKIARDAFIFAYPMLENYKTMYTQAIDESSAGYQAPFNQLVNFSKLLGPDFTAVVRPNNDTPYSFVWMDLRAEPMVISVPAIPKSRYYSFQLVDMFTYNFAYIGTRTTGTKAGYYLVAGPGWTGEKPEGIDRVFKSEGNFVLSITRTAVSGPDDLPNLIAIQEKYRAVPLSVFLGTSSPESPSTENFPAYDHRMAFTPGFMVYFNFLMGQVEVDPSEAEVIDRFGAVGIGPDAELDPHHLTPEMSQSISKGIDAAVSEIKESISTLGQQKNGWTLTPRIFGDRKQMQEKYLTRAAAAMFGLYGNDLEEAYYPTANTDGTGAELDGSKHNYVLHFDQGELPAVDAFWSITMYSLPKQLMVANPINRYSIGDRTKGLKFGDDGSLTIYLQHESPGSDMESNWLPAPDGLFSATMRMYLPKPEALDPLYAPPPITIAN